MKILFSRAAVIVLMLLATTSWLAAEQAGADPAPVKASLLASVDAAAPSKSFVVGVRLKLAPHWHIYWINPGESGAAPQITPSGPDGFEFGPIQWPLPTRIDIDGGVTYGYEDEVLLLIPVKAPKELGAGRNVTLTADASWLVCKESCIEGKATLSVTLPVANHSKPTHAELFEKWQDRLPMPKEKSGEVLANVDQATGPDGSPAPAISMRWRQAPRKVEWFPIATSAVAIENVNVEHNGELTRISYKPTIYKPDRVPGGRLDSVVVYEDAQGRRRGVVVPLRISSQR
jgi:DsbC/DsbD-like thiol-disulfide interchange protein